MIKSALQYIVSMREPKLVDVNGVTYSDKELNRVAYNPKADPIELTTLSSLIEYIKSNADTMRGRMFVHVVSPTKVRMYSQLDEDRERECIAVVNANVPEFRFNQWVDHENFCIGLQSKFQDNDDRKLLLQFAGTVEKGSISQYGDDGVTQKATVKTGIASKSEAIVPSPATLRAYRTFVEVEQPETQYVFRMQDKMGIQCALYEADGGAWKNEAMKNVAEYLREHLEFDPIYTVIS